jgi:hypothetical protein
MGRTNPLGQRLHQTVRAVHGNKIVRLQIKKEPQRYQDLWIKRFPGLGAERRPVD